jgi:Macrocin-O-methyltransferase (TylF)
MSPAVPLTALEPVAMPRLIENGRCVYDGYQRGTALKFGGLADAVWRDPVFRKAVSASRLTPVRTMISDERLTNLFLIIKFFLGNLDAQNIIEFGAFRGGGTIFMAMLLREFYPFARVYGLDTFEGMPNVRTGLDNPPPDDFAAVNLETSRRTARSLGLTNIEFVPGPIESTTADVYRRGAPFGLANVDVVLYSSVVHAQSTVWSQMTPGGYVINDDATEPTCPGATQAITELIRDKNVSIEQVWPHIVLRTP